MTEDAGSRRAKVIILGLCLIAAGTIASAAVYRYAFWGNQLPGGFAASPADHDGDGMPEYLITRAIVNLPESGDYGASALLIQPATGTVVAQTTGRVELDRGENVFGAGFWGPDIRKGEISGPYIERLTFVREQSDQLFEPTASPDMLGRVYTWDFTTPAYDWRTFQEQPTAVAISGPVTSTRTDFDGDGRTDTYMINVPLTVNTAGTYGIRAASEELTLQGVTDRFTPPGVQALGPQFVTLSPGPQTVRIPMAPEMMYLSGVDGPVDYRITVSDAGIASDPCDWFGPGGYVEQPEFAPPPDGSDFGLRRPYVLPPTPLGLKAEASFAESVHWYEFEAPWMPIEFTGDVRDFGTDVDGDGLYDYLSVAADVIVHQLGVYDLSGTLYAQGAEPSSMVLLRSVPKEEFVVTTAWSRLSLNDWSYLEQVQAVQLEFAGAEIIAAGHDGPYDAKLRIVPANIVIDPVIVHTTAAYTLAEFEETGAKPYELGGVDIKPDGQDQFIIVVDATGIDSSYQVLVRVIHANGVVSLDTSFWAGRTREFLFGTDGERAKDFAVAVYLMGPGSEGVDYIETPLATE